MVISIKSLVLVGTMVVALVFMGWLLSVASMSGLVGLEPLHLPVIKKLVLPCECELL